MSYSIYWDAYTRCKDRLEEFWAKQVYSSACFRIGKCFYEGKGIEQDTIKAEHFLAEAHCYYKLRMDTAFKRRWSFEYIGIDENEQNVRGIFQAGSGKDAMDIDWNDLRKAINERLSNDLKVNEDKLLGPYFIEEKYIKTGDDGRMEYETEFLQVFKSKVLMYLFEDAARQYRTKLFVCEGNTRYSSICEKFDEQGVLIFGPDFAERLRIKAENAGIDVNLPEADS